MNRRRIRGAELYDLMMSDQFSRDQREVRPGLSIRQVVQRLTQQWRAQDLAAGREVTWNTPQEAMSRASSPKVYGGKAYRV